MSRLLLAACLAACLAAGPALGAETRQVAGFAPNPGDLLMFEYVPDGLPPGSPLVVALHGCTQSAKEFGDDSGWAGLAERYRFALLLPEQQEANNEDLCFDWFRDEDNRRDRGEAASIRAMVDRTVADHGLDPGRVFVTGLSAGGAMTAVMLAAYPEVFAGGAVIAGVPYGCASTDGEPFLAAQRQAFLATNPFLGEAGWAAYACGDHALAGPVRLHALRPGAGDLGRAGPRGRRPDPAGLAEGVALAGRRRRDRRPDEPAGAAGPVDRGRGDRRGAGRGGDDGRLPAPRVRGRGGRGQGRDVRAAGDGACRPVDPGSGPERCGRAGRYFADRHVCAAYRIARFWGLTDGR